MFDGYPGAPENTLDDNRAVGDVPYVGYADVTSILQGLANPNGTYTVADAKAYTGFTDGGGYCRRMGTGCHL